MILRTLLLMLACGATHADSYLITHVTVLPMTDEGAPRGDSIPGQDVLIVDGRIEEIAKSIRNAPEDAQRVEGTGKFLMPGLWDMHVHLSGNADTALPMFLANGVTGVRDMGAIPKIYLPCAMRLPRGNELDRVS